METNIETKDLKYMILKTLEKKYSCAKEIMKQLKQEQIDFDEKKFYPSLSYLQLEKLCCTHWINEEGFPVKYYHLTKNGYYYIHKF